MTKNKAEYSGKCKRFNLMKAIWVVLIWKISEQTERPYLCLRNGPLNWTNQKSFLVSKLRFVKTAYLLIFYSFKLTCLFFCNYKVGTIGCQIYLNTYDGQPSNVETVNKVSIALATSSKWNLLLLHSRSINLGLLISPLS